MKELLVTMKISVKDECSISEIKRWENHIDWAINLEEWPEIEQISGVKVDEIKEAK